MRRDPDILVVGGGIVGLFCAYYLRRSGASVAVLERDEVGGAQASSYGNTGFVGTTGAMPLAEPGVLSQGLRWLLKPDSPFYIKPRWDSELAAWLLHFRRACTMERAMAGFGALLEMKKKSLEIFREVAAYEKVAPFFQAHGKLSVFNTQQAFDKACEAAQQSLAAGVPLRILSPDEMRRHYEPDAPFKICGAIFNQEDAHLSSPAFVVGFADVLKGMGVNIHPHARVIDFETAGQTVTLVKTTQGDFKPREIVIAAGTWSAECARKLNIRLMLQPAKGYSVTVKAPRNGPRLPVLLAEGRVALTPLGDRLRFGGTLQLVGMDRTVSSRRIDGIRRTVQAYLPDLEETEVTEVWSGFRPCTPDGVPYVGRAETYRNVLLACGHGHIGMGLAPISGKLISQIVAGEAPDMEMTPFRIDRFDGQLPRVFRFFAGHGSAHLEAAK
jgi:D-amino-acid dehydrogenase